VYCQWDSEEVKYEWQSSCIGSAGIVADSNPESEFNGL